MYTSTHIEIYVMDTPIRSDSSVVSEYEAAPEASEVEFAVYEDDDSARCGRCAGYYTIATVKLFIGSVSEKFPEDAQTCFSSSECKNLPSPP